MAAHPIEVALTAMVTQLTELRDTLATILEDGVPPTTERLQELALGLHQWRKEARRLEIENKSQGGRLGEIEQKLQVIQAELAVAKQ